MKKTILIVDDSKTERVLLRGFLKDEYEILEAENGKEAIELLDATEQEIAAIVMDVIMPEMDGFQTMAAVRANTAWIGIPIIITTGLDDEESREKAISFGADSFVIKPFKHDVLSSTIENAIRLREMSSMPNTLVRDSLTGLLNRESFFAEAERMINRKEPGFYTLSCFDIENFKVINDQYGSDIGDKVLQHIATVLNSFVGEINGLGGRYMADKFSILYPTKMRGSEMFQQKHNEMINTEFVQRPIRICIGRYLVHDLSLPVSTMFDRASLAITFIKGRYETFISEYTEEMRDNLLYEQQIVGTMASALENGEFMPWFQPQYNHATGALIGAEALVRWSHDGKIIPPNSFIPVFERNGFVYEVDQAIWRQVCMHLHRWIEAGMELVPVSVNISRYDLFQTDFLEVLISLTQEFSIPVNMLRLEITESAFSESTNTINIVVGKLIDYGFTVEIDDFGSGYSSLNTLKDVPASILKLDMRFFETNENSQRGGNIVESVVRMAKWLGMAVIAEGVENREQADYLKTIGCLYIQGYYYAKPMPLEEYESLLMSGAKEEKLNGLQTVTEMDNNRFWDPKSMETLIFNSYVGGACIFEYHDGVTELLRMNEQYILELRGLIPKGTRLSSASIREHMPYDEREKIIQAVEKAISTGKEASVEVKLVQSIVDDKDSDKKCVNIDNKNVIEKGATDRAETSPTDNAVNGSERVEFIRMTVRIIASTGERYLFYAVILNMTDQRLAEKQRAESAERLKIIMENVSGSVSAMKMDDVGNTTLIFGNDKYYEIFGYTKEEAESINLDAMSCVVPEDFDDVVAKLNKLRIDGIPINIDYRAQKKDGSVVFIRSKATRMSMEGYGDDVIVSVMMDITEQRTLQDQLKAVIDNINGGVSATYLKGDSENPGKLEFVIINEKYYELIGYSRQEFEKEVPSIFDIIHPDDRERVEKLFMEANKQKGQYTMEYRVIRQNGAIRHILCNTSVMNLFGIKELVQLAVSNDITLLRETQQKNLETMDRLQAVMNSMCNGLTAVAFHGEYTELLFANDLFYQMHGIKRGEYDLGKLHHTLELIHSDDQKLVREAINSATEVGQTTQVEYRIVKEDNSIIWVRAIIRVISLSGVKVPVQVALYMDITSEKEAAAHISLLIGNRDHICMVDRTAEIKPNESERLRLLEEEYRIVASHSDKVIARFDIAKRSLTLAEAVSKRLKLPKTLYNIPNSDLTSEIISSDTKEKYREFYNEIMEGVKDVKATYCMKVNDQWRWIEARSTTIFDSDRKPVSAIISYLDITRQREQEAIYLQWENSLAERPEDSYTLFRCNLSKGGSYETWTGKLIDIDFEDKNCSFDGRTNEFIEQCVYADDRERYRRFMNLDSLLADYYRGHRTKSLEFRQPIGLDCVRWLNLTVDLVKYSDSDDVEATLMYEDVDERKRQEISTLERANTDPLTGVLNRVAFAKRVNSIISTSNVGTFHALLMLDLDGFKQVNDVLGHGVGDQVLVDIANILTKGSRKDDLIGRLGGDEFLVFLSDVQGADAAARKAEKICIAAQMAFGSGVQTSASIGAAVYPHDGEGFESLYKIADKMLYRVKESGKNGYAFNYGEPAVFIERFGHEEEDERNEYKLDASRIAWGDNPNALKETNVKRMLIVDDSEIDVELLMANFRSEFHIEKASNGELALAKLSHYGSSISVVLLDLMMPGMDGIEVLKKMQENANIRNIPVIVVSGDDNRETVLEVVREGAADFVTKPVDMEILRIRVDSAVSRSENERLRMQNTYLTMYNDEIKSYELALEHEGMLVVTQEWGSNEFTYSKNVSTTLLGTFEGRTFWRALLSNMVAETKTVEKMQNLVHDIAQDRERMQGCMNVRLKNADGFPTNYEFCAYKEVNIYGLTERIIMTIKKMDTLTDEQQVAKKELQKMFPIALTTMMATSSDFSYVMDQDMHYVCCSPTMATRLGLENPDDIFGLTNYDLFGEEIGREFEDNNRKLLETGEPSLNKEECVIMKSGEIVYVNTSIYPIRDKEGKLIGQYGFSHDISHEHKLTFELDTLLNSIPSGILKYSADEGEQIEYINRNFIESLGYTRETFMAKFNNCFRNVIWHEDREWTEEEIKRQEGDGSIGRFEYRVESADGTLHWIHDEGIKITDENGRSWYYVTLFDITEQRIAQEQLRVSEEVNRLAMAQSDRIVTQFDVESRTLLLPDSLTSIFKLPHCLTNLPEEQIEAGCISKNTAENYRKLYQEIIDGSPEGRAIYQQQSTIGWRWLEAHYTTVFSDSGEPLSAVITLNDITEKLEKEIIYKKWQQSLEKRAKNSYTLFRCNLNKNTVFDSHEGMLFDIPPSVENVSIKKMKDYYLKQVVPEDRDALDSFLNIDSMLASYYRGIRADEIQFREKMEDESIHWRLLSVDLVQYPNSSEVEAYLLFEDITEAKNAELAITEQAESDPLTGVLNRITFAAKMEAAISAATSDAKHALLMFDIDDFKTINDTYGHKLGDTALQSVTKRVQDIICDGDLVGRLGGDEFFVFLHDIKDQAEVARKADMLCAMSVPLEEDVLKITISMGISIIPDDGTDFEELYRKVDTALYKKKRSGKDGYLFVEKKSQE